MNRLRHSLISTLCLAILLSTGCSSSRSLKLHDWQKLPKAEYTIPPFAKYLQKYKIAVDPGHGGLAHLPGYKRGPTGKREAEMNLRVAYFLKEFLEKAGAQVVLTRTADTFVSLADRNAIAEKEGCDFLISLHHNVDEDPKTNYVAVYYHLHPDFSPLSLDLARNVYFALVEALRLPQVAEDGLLTDRLHYPAGFGLLRRSKIPAILLETSFYSNPAEEKRLSDWRYNRREAYAIFLGLARWAAGGIPSAELQQPAKVSRNKQPEIVYALRDGIIERGGRSDGRLLIFSESTTLSIDGTRVRPTVNLGRGELRYTPEQPLDNGVHLLQVSVQNLFKNHNFPRVDTLIIAAPTDSIVFHVPVAVLPADGRAVIPVTVCAFDASGRPVWEGTRIALRADRGQVEPDTALPVAGEAIFYYKVPSAGNNATLIATADDHVDSLHLALLPPHRGEQRIFSGIIRDEATGQGIAGASITLNDSLQVQTDRNGSFFLHKPPAGVVEFGVSCPGYTPVTPKLQLDSLNSTFLEFALQPRLGGLLHGETIVIDAAGGAGSRTGDGKVETFEDGRRAAALNLRLAQRLADTLRWAGARPVLIREDEQDIPVDTRIEKVNAVPEGWYLKLRYAPAATDTPRVIVTGYPGNVAGAEMAAAIGRVFREQTGARVELRQNTAIREVTLTNKTALEVAILCRRPEATGSHLHALFDGIVLSKQAALRGESLLENRDR